MKYESSETQDTRKIQRTVQKNEKLRTVKNIEKKIYVTFSKLKLNESILFPKRVRKNSYVGAFSSNLLKSRRFQIENCRKGRRQYERVGVWVERGGVLNTERKKFRGIGT